MKQFRVTLLCLLVIVAMRASSAHATTAEEYQTAIEMYQEERYGEAASLLWKVIQKDKSFADGYVYYSTCCWLLGDKETALRSYWYFARHFQTHKQIKSVMGFLKKNDGAYDAHFKDAGYATMHSSPLATASKAKTESKTRSSPKAAESYNLSVIEGLVKTVKPQKNRPAVSSSLEYWTKEALKEYPPKLLALIHDRDCKIWLTPTLIDKEPSYENRQPSGYMEGSTYKDCPGMFHQGDIVVCEYLISNGFDWEQTRDPIGTLKHELGHAVDYYLGQLSETEEYRHAYLLDVGQIKDDSVRNKISYYLQKDIRGQHEAFAELMSAKYGGGKDEKTTSLMKANFPLTMKFIDKKIKEFELNADEEE